MKFSLKLLALALVMVSGVAIARDPHRLEHWQETIKALKKVGYTDDSEIVHWADHNLKRAETAALHHDGQAKHTKVKHTTKAKSDESWFEKAKEYVTGSKPKAREVAGTVATTAGTAAASAEKKARKPVRTTTRTAKSATAEEVKHQEELAKRRKAYADKKAAEAKAEEKHQEDLAKRRARYAEKRAEEAAAAA